MSSLFIFRDAMVHALRSGIRTNLQKYASEDVWVTEAYPRNSRDLQTGVEVGDGLRLELPEDGDLKDTQNAIRIHKALRDLTPLQARDPRLWTRLTHVDLWQYMRLRWPVKRHLSDEGRAARFVESRYFIPQAQSRALLRNGIARLWWTAQMSHDADRENPYELTSVLLSTLDITQQIVERSMGRAENVIKGFLTFLLQNSTVLLAGGNLNRTRIRKLAKHLNMIGGVSLLDLLSQTEVIEILDNELRRIVAAEAKEDGEAAAE